MPIAEKLSVTASDVSGQKAAKLSGLTADTSIREIVKGFVSVLELPKNGVDGEPLSYQARLDREGRHLHESEKAGSALLDQDHLVLQPNIDAG